jgi:hypothetical protein
MGRRMAQSRRGSSAFGICKFPATEPKVGENTHINGSFPRSFRESEQVVLICPNVGVWEDGIGFHRGDVWFIRVLQLFEREIVILGYE